MAGRAKLTRRGFISAAAAAAAGLWLPRGAGAAPAPAGKARWPDLAAVKGGAPAELFDAGIAALGGMGRFVARGATVLVKPNIGWEKTPDEAANTNPELAARVVAAALKAGASRVWCLDHSVNVEKRCWRSSGIAAAVRAAGGVMATAEDEDDYRRVELKGEVLKDVLVHRLYLDCDAVINVPVLKDHAGGRITGALKNLMGVVWDRRHWHRKGLLQAIGEFPLCRKPALNVIDAYLVMMRNGPRGISSDDLELKKLQILSADIVLADAAGARTLGRKVPDVPSIGIAAALGLGSQDLDKADIRRISLG